MSTSLFTKANELLVEAIVEARRSKGVRQVDLAQRLGKNQSYISNIERGQRRLDIVEFYALASALDCDPVELFRIATLHFPTDIEI